ncbi:MAG TPA: pyridoxal-dependent decarboxylase [Terriglobales bacterium]|nr:pyridoxal-dependent decarboxylase [Terriglobales bacterium]
MNPLDLSPEEFRHLAERAVQEAGEYLAGLDSRPTFPSTSGGQTTKIFSSQLPEQGMGARAFDAVAEIFAHSRPGNGRFFGYVFGSGEPVGAVADLVAGVLNQNVTAWRSAPAAVSIERTVIGWLGEALGCAGFSGSLCGGGSSANLMALAMAREAKAPANQRGTQPGVVYASEEVHMSVPKALALLGLGYGSLRTIATDERYRIKFDALSEAMEADARAGKRIVAVVGSAGTVNTGSIDPLAEMAELAQRHGAWFHVDGAYGALAALAVPEKFKGMERADSISLDPHKWLYQPVDCGCLLYRDPAAAQAAFAHSGDYTKVLSKDPIEGFAFFEESMELSRRFRALKVWLSLRYHGLEAFRRAIGRDLEHGQRLARRVAATPELEVLAPVELSAVCFRYTRGDDLNGLNAAILRRVIERGRVYLSNTTLRGKFALRACFVNHRTVESDVDAIIEEVLAAAGEVRASQKTHAS